jgi:hypothetical protein
MSYQDNSKHNINMPFEPRHIPNREQVKETIFSSISRSIMSIFTSHCFSNSHGSSLPPSDFVLIFFKFFSHRWCDHSDFSISTKYSRFSRCVSDFLWVDQILQWPNHKMLKLVLFHSFFWRYVSWKPPCKFTSLNWHIGGVLSCVLGIKYESWELAQHFLHCFIKNVFLVIIEKNPIFRNSTRYHLLLICLEPLCFVPFKLYVEYKEWI